MTSIPQSIFQEKLALYQQQRREMSKEKGKLNQMLKTRYDYSRTRDSVLEKTKSKPIMSYNERTLARRRIRAPERVMTPGNYRSIAPGIPKLIKGT